MSRSRPSSVDADYLEHMAAESREGDVTPPPSRKSTPLPLGEEATDFGDRLRFVLCVRRGINEALVNESLAEARALMPRRAR